jgi:streptomycin 6-kinase
MDLLFTKNIATIYGEAGVHWLDLLPHLTKLYAKRWHLEELKEVPDLSFNYVLSGYRGSQAIILKFNPEPWSLAAEARALKAFAGPGMAALLAEGEEALLIEYADGGQSLKEYAFAHDFEAINIFCSVAGKLHQAVRYEEKFVHIRDWLSELENNWPISNFVLDRARLIKNHLLESSGPYILLHGDLHQGNILKHKNDWIAIDPKGVVGEALYEAGAFIRNPEALLINLPKVEALNIIKSRIEKIAHFYKAPPKRLAQWCFVQTVLSWIWAIQDGIETTDKERLITLWEACAL